MGLEHKIKFYPVENADTTLFKLDDKTTILIDCQFKKSDESPNGDKRFPVKEDLLNELEKKDNNPFVDLFILSHPHEDHCLGFGDNFYTGKPSDYSKSNREKGEILIGELWITQNVFHNNITNEAKEIRKEAKRRREMFEKKESGWNSFGNRLHIIGYNDEDKTVDGLHYTPGREITEINGDEKDLFSIFIHSPFKSNLIESRADEDENLASIAFQANFRTVKDGDVKTKVMMSGDADHYVWKKIKEITESNDRKDKLEWDLFLSPHHCSWSFFNDRPYDNNKLPKDTSLAVLDYARENAHIIASSIKIVSSKPNPPHYSAKLEYEKKVGSTRFINTATHHIDKEIPQPLVYMINENGFKLGKAIVGAATTITSKSYRAG